MSSSALICPNCGAEGTARFCAECGQRHGELVPTLRSWVLEAVDELLGVDGRLPRSIQKLFWPPGELMLEWMRGRRARYVRPFRLYLAAALVLFLAWPQTAFYSALEGMTVGFLEADADATTLGAVDSRVQLGTQVVTESLPGLLIILFVPFFGMALQFVNRGGVGYIHHFVSALHIHTVTFTTMVATLPLQLVLGDSWEDWVMPPTLLALVAYVTAFIARVYGVGPVRALARTVTVTGIYLLVVSIVIGALLAIVLASG